MSFDGFLKIDGIVGESTDDQHDGWIEVVYFEINLKQKSSSTTSSVGGASSERADFSDFIFFWNSSNIYFNSFSTHKIHSRCVSNQVLLCNHCF